MVGLSWLVSEAGAGPVSEAPASVWVDVLLVAARVIVDDVIGMVVGAAEVYDVCVGDVLTDNVASSAGNGKSWS